MPFGWPPSARVPPSVASSFSGATAAVLVFFFQAEDGIRDDLVTEFRRVLFRSPPPPRGHAGAIPRSCTLSSPRRLAVRDAGREVVGACKARASALLLRAVSYVVKTGGWSVY